MADNITLTGALATFVGASVEATFSGDTTQLLLAAQADYEGSEGARTVNELHRKYSRADTFTTAASGTTVDVSKHSVSSFAIQAKGTGAAATAWVILLEGSLDGTNFFHIGTHSNIGEIDGQVKALRATFPVLYFRSRCVSITLGSATNIVVTILGVPRAGGGSNPVTNKHIVTAATTNATILKAAPAVLRSITGIDFAAYPLKVCAHDIATTPTAGSTPIKFATVIMPGLPHPNPVPAGGIPFNVGLAFTIVKADAAADLADTGADATAANDGIAEFGYE